MTQGEQTHPRDGAWIPESPPGWRAARESWQCSSDCTGVRNTLLVYWTAEIWGCLLQQLALITLSNTTIMMKRAKVGIQVRQKGRATQEQESWTEEEASGSPSSPPVVYQVLGFPGSHCQKKKKKFWVFLVQLHSKLCWSHLNPKTCWSYCWLRDIVRPLITEQGCQVQDPMEKHWHDVLGRPHIEEECGLRPKPTQEHTQDWANTAQASRLKQDKDGIICPEDNSVCQIVH